jgi:hypothetical protein
VNIALDHRQAADHLLDGVMNRLERILGALLAPLDLGNIAHNGGDRGWRACGRCGRDVGAAKRIDMRKQVGDAALDRGQLPEPRI